MAEAWPGYESKAHGASPVAQWLSSCVPLQRPRVLPVWILGADIAPLISHTEVASHVPQLEGPTTKIYNYVLEGFGEEYAERKKKWQQLLAQVPIFRKKIR